jgi:hypothetical protein
VSKNENYSALYSRILTDKLNGHIREQGPCLMDSNRGRITRNDASIAVQYILDLHGLENGWGSSGLSQSLSL